MSKIAIIGANSYIARNLIHKLKLSKEKHEIFLYDYTTQHIDAENNYHCVNMLSDEDVQKLDLLCDIIFMFVGKTGSANGFECPNMFIDINERALLNLLNEYRRQGSTAKIVFPSTRLVYKGKNGTLKEDAEKEFKTVYAINKFACEQYLEQYNQVFDVKYCILRICVPYGTLIKDASSYGTAEFMLVKAQNGENIELFGDGSARRTITYIGDLCSTLIAAAFNEKCVNDIYNIGGENYSLNEMAVLIASKYNVGIDYVEWPEISKKIESGDTVFDGSKLQKLIGNTTRYQFENWIKKGE